MMLGKADLVAFIPTTNPEKARAFYENVLGLHFVSDDKFALVFDSNGVTIRIANVSGVPIRLRRSPFLDGRCPTSR